MAIRDRLTAGELALTRSDLKVARVLLSNYPAAGLGTVAQLASAAGVSNPTVVRFVSRLGFEGFPEFQAALVAEVQERMSSPLIMLDAGKGTSAGAGTYSEVLHAGMASLDAALGMVPAGEFEAAVSLLADPALRIHCIGGRFSGYLAGLLWTHLHLLRADCHWRYGSRSELADALVDIGRRDLVIAYDYRRYQHDTIQFAAESVRNGARIMLMTDRWKSPIAEYADVVLTAPVDGPSPFDTMLPALAQTEALIAALTVRLGGSSRARIERLEHLRRAASITEDVPAVWNKPSGDKSVSSGQGTE